MGDELEKLTPEELLLMYRSPESAKARVELLNRLNAYDDMKEALIKIRIELASLFPNPKNPLFQNAQAICVSENDGDAQCILNAYLLTKLVESEIRRPVKESP